ncbi:hypothetical protein SAMN05192543_108114 [Paraburkholderia megapolitana]|uniref:Uncharacterized protein n=1 Tax=Paraburkholderia megapolitana TaxID=420953 RepID=A0A1I3SAL0_9BURK|nr:hypothetical protein SAMN05192543_108114 [Paraburkholderia megapolitana]
MPLDLSHIARLLVVLVVAIGVVKLFGYLRRNR